MSSTQFIPGYSCLQESCSRMWKTDYRGWVFYFATQSHLCFVLWGFFFFSFGLKVYEILVPPPMIKPTSLCFGRQNLNHWTPGSPSKPYLKPSHSVVHLCWKLGSICPSCPPLAWGGRTGISGCVKLLLLQLPRILDIFRMNIKGKNVPCVLKF